MSDDEYFILEMIRNGIFGLMSMTNKVRLAQNLVDHGMVSVYYEPEDTERDHPFFSITTRGHDALERHHLEQRLRGTRQ